MSVDPYYYPSTSGYVCSICGVFVPYNTIHHCAGYTTPAPSVKWDRMSDVRIADALERIAAALEKLSAREEAR